MALVTTDRTGDPGSPEARPAPPDSSPLDVRVEAEPAVDSTEWHRLPAAAGVVKGIAGAVTGLVLGGPASFALTEPIGNMMLRLPAMLGIMLAAAGAGAWLGRARWRRTRWRLDHRGLRVRRGLLWHVEVLVPRSRVQHLDIERGPLERHFGLATLVVHTAGSQTQALRQPGLADADAVTLRDVLIPAAARDGDAL
jgi:membrane protein YdbS with pleckstrin-like domain